MEITQIKPINSKRSRIYIDGICAFELYKGEVRRYQLAEGEELPDTVYEEILQMLLKRGKARALHLLETMDRTEGQLRQKLRAGGYPELVTEQILDYVKSFHYVDDERYVSNYIRSRGKTKSFRQMRAELMRKGVPSEQISVVAEQEEAVDDTAAIRAWMAKKRIDPDLTDRGQMLKFYQFLLRKGFSYEDIRQELKIYEIYD